jgi:hypothetical protein
MSPSIEKNTQPCVSDKELITEQQHASSSNEDDDNLDTGRQWKITHEILDVNNQRDVG